MFSVIFTTYVLHNTKLNDRWQLLTTNYKCQDLSLKIFITVVLLSCNNFRWILLPRIPARFAVPEHLLKHLQNIHNRKKALWAPFSKTSLRRNFALRFEISCFRELWRCPAIWPHLSFIRSKTCEHVKEFSQSQRESRQKLSYRLAWQLHAQSDILEPARMCDLCCHVSKIFDSLIAPSEHALPWNPGCFAVYKNKAMYDKSIIRWRSAISQNLVILRSKTILK